MTESLQSVDTDRIRCPDCGLRAARQVFSPGHLPGVSGFAVAPMRERRIPITDAMTALGDAQATARKRGIDAPDFLAMAKSRASIISRHAPELAAGT